MKPIDILLVEDNEGDIMLTLEAFGEWEKLKNISVARDGQAAIDFFDSNNTRSQLPDLVLLDINLPKRNGQEVLKFIKTTANLKHIPVIMLTTSSSPNDINQAYDNYANCYITKPNEVKSFFHLVSAIESFWVSIAKLPCKN